MKDSHQCRPLCACTEHIAITTDTHLPLPRIASSLDTSSYSLNKAKLFNGMCPILVQPLMVKLVVLRCPVGGRFTEPYCIGVPRDFLLCSVQRFELSTQVAFLSIFSSGQCFADAVRIPASYDNHNT